MLEGRIGCTVVGGGGCAEVKQVVERKWGALAGLQCVVLCIGGNETSRWRAGEG
jgi:hypothetical protein